MLRLRFERADQVYVPEEIRPDCCVILPLEEVKKYLDTAENHGDVWAEIPSVIWPSDESEIRESLEALRDLGVVHAIAENIGAVEIAFELGFRVHGGFTLNAYNSAAIDQYALLGLEDITVSFEMAVSDYKKLKTKIPAGLVTYGYLPLMKFRNCPVKAQAGCAGCRGQGFIRDRKNEVFPVICRGKRYSELLNCVPLYLGDRKLQGVPFELLYFTIESREDVKSVLSVYAAGLAPDFRRTSGLYYRDVL